MRTDISILSGGIGASVPPVKRIPINKSNMKSPAMSPPRKDLIPNQDINRLITKKYQSFSPHLANFPPRFKTLINDAHGTNSTEDYHNDSTNTSRNQKEDSVKNMKVTNSKDIQDEYKDENLQALNSNESDI